MSCMVYVMTYSIDLRRRVVEFVVAGGSKSEASRRFSICRATVYQWTSLGEDLSPKRYERTRARKLDERALAAHVEAHPLMLARDRAVIFEVHPTSITRALKRIGIRRKKHRRATVSDAQSSAPPTLPACAV